jgi:hypothetical protein
VAILRNEVQRHKLNLLYVLGITDDIKRTLLDEVKPDLASVPSAQESLVSALQDRFEMKA